MTARLAAALAFVLVLLLTLLGACWRAWEAGGDHRENALRAQYADAAAAAELIARAKEQAMHYQLQEAQDAAKVRERNLLSAAAGARGQLDRLRDTLATRRQQLPDLPETTLRHHADTASVLLRDCAERYTALAETTDRIDNDRQTLMEAWPR